jgi:hypothetical protein
MLTMGPDSLACDSLAATTPIPDENHQRVPCTEHSVEMLAENAICNDDVVNSAPVDKSVDRSHNVVQAGGSLVGSWNHRLREMVNLDACQQWRLPNGNLVNAKNTVQWHSMLDRQDDGTTISNFYKRIQGVHQLIMSTATDTINSGIENGSKDSLPQDTLDSMDPALSVAVSRPMIPAVPIYRTDGVPLPWQEAQGETLDFPTSIAVGLSSVEDQSQPSSAIQSMPKDTIPTDKNSPSWAWRLSRGKWTPLVMAFILILAMVVGGICGNGHCASPDSDTIYGGLSRCILYPHGGGT